LELSKNVKESTYEKDLGLPEASLIEIHNLISLAYQKIYDNLGESIIYLEKLSDNQKDLRKLLKLIPIQMWHPDDIDLLNSENLKRNRLNLKKHLFYNMRPNTVTVTLEKPPVEYILTRICWCGHEKSLHGSEFYGETKCSVMPCSCERFEL
jgi:hypothetical protein